MTKKPIDKSLYNTKEGVQFSATSSMSNAILLLVASTLLSFIVTNLLKLTSSNTFNTIILAITPIANIAAFIIFHSALKKEQAAFMLKKDEEPDVFLEILKRLIVICLIATFVLFFIYIIMDYRVKLLIKAAGDDEIAFYNATKLSTQLKVIINSLNKVFSLTNISCLFIGGIYVREEGNKRLHNFAFAAVIITLISFLMVIINYILQYIGKTNVIYSTISNLTIYAVYFSQYLTFEARKEKLKAILSCS